jgi:uroporphyrinogen decarboxylase
MLGPKQYKEFSGEYIKDVIKRFKGLGVNIVLHICGNTMHIIDSMVDTGADGISLDARQTGVDLAAVAEQTPEDIAVIGNISPTEVMLSSTPEEVRTAVEELMDNMKTYPHFILSTGCDLPQAVPAENLLAFMEAGRAKLSQ